MQYGAAVHLGETAIIVEKAQDREALLALELFNDSKL
jgi:hypothetical protein